MKRRHFAACLISLACLLAPTARTQTVSCTINVPGFDAGSYDVYGESDTRREGGGAGLGALSHVRGPYHSFIAFHIPDFAGTITSASLVGNAFVSSYNAAETLAFFSVTSSVTSVLDGGLGHVAIYDDLGSGGSYGSCTLASGYWITAVPLNENAVADIQGARGNDFVIGGALLNVTAPPEYNAFVDFPEYRADQVTLRLEISAPAQPTIHTQPPAQNPLSVSNSPALFSVGACGAEPMLYRWFVNGIGQSWQSSAPFYAADLTTNPVPVFVIVSNAFGTATSSVVEAKFPPAIFRPAFTNLTVRVGDTVNLVPFAQVFAYPSEWTWKKDGVPFSPDQNYYQLYLWNLQASDSGDYTLTISNSLGLVTSPVMRLRVVETPPVFWEEPYDQRVPLGSIVYLGATAAAGPSASYQWYFNGAPIVSTNASLELPHISNTQTGRYYVVASNAFGKATSDVVSVTTYLDPPEFLQNPRDATIYPGGYTLLGVSLRGQPYPSVQWLHDGVPIPGATSEILQIHSASSNSAGAYVCVASNASGMTISSPAQVSVLYVPPVLDISPTNLVSGAGYPAVFYVHVLNPPASLELQREGMNVPGVILNGGPEYFTLQFSNVGTNQSGLYRIVAGNAYGMSTSAVLSLTVTSSPPSFALSPQSQTAMEGTDVWLTFDAGAAPAPTFTLYHDNLPTPLVAKDDQFFVLRHTSLADAGEYFIVASNRIGRATSDVARITIQRAGPLDKWTQRNPSPQGNELFAIAFGQDKFVAVGRNGAIITSANGTNWNVRSIRTTAELHDIAYANGQFVVVGEDGIVLTSTNGESWTRQTLPAAVLRGIAFGADCFVAVGQKIEYMGGPAIFVSSNALDWIEITTNFPAASELTAIAFGPGGFAVADAYQGNYFSSDLISWNSSTTNLFDTESVRYLNGKYFAVGSGGRTAMSADARTWNSQTITTRKLFDIACGANRYVIVGAKGNLFHSSDAALWSPAPSLVNEDLEGVAFGNGLFAAVGEHGIILTSADGQNWFSQIVGSANDLDGLAVANGLAVAVGKNNTILVSRNGSDWTSCPVTGADAQDDWHGVAFGNGKWIAVGDSTNILVSSDGLEWQAHWPGLTPPYLKSVLYANGLWVAVGLFGTILTSPDGVTWAIQPSLVPYDLNEVAYGNGQFVVVGDHVTTPNATILTSADGAIWFDRSFLFAGKNARGISFANGAFVVALNDGRVMHSTDPQNGSWTIVATGIASDGANLRGLTWSNNLWVVVGNDGLLLTSTNAFDWRPRITPTDENLHAVKFFNNSFIVVGNGGTILQSDPITSTLLVEREGSRLRLIFSSPYEGEFHLQQTEDFNWKDLGVISNSVGTVETNVTLPPGAGKQFYRVVP